MADDTSKVGKGDRIRASQQVHEVRYLADKFRVSWQAALGAIRAAGPMRKRVEAYLRDKAKTASSKR